MAGKPKNRIKMIILIAIVVCVLILAILINVIGFSKTLNPNQANKTGLDLGFSTPEKKEEAPKTTDNKEGTNKISAKTNSVVLVQLKNNNWDMMKSKLNIENTQKENVYSSKEGYKIYCNGTYVNYIVFNENYKGKVISDIAVGTPLEDIKKSLGEPSFLREGLLGYESGEYYTFFYEDEIAVYPNRTLSNTELEKLIFAYNSGSYDGNRTNLLVEFRDKYPDFSIDMYGDIVVLTSLTRQIELRLFNDGTMDMTIYTGYNMGQTMKSHLGEENITKEEIYLVEYYEAERVGV